jgi:hypothetical protein
VNTEAIGVKLEALAAKLGVAAQHVWGVLTQQAYVEAVGWAAWAAFWICIAVIANMGRKRVIAFADAEDNYDSDAYRTAAWIASAIVWAITAIAVMNCAVSALSYIANPEFYALQKIAELLK